MRIAVRIAVGLVVLVALAGIVGLLLPREHRASSVIHLEVPADSVWVVMRDLGALPSWWNEVASMTRDTTAPGEVWLQGSEWGTARVTVLEEDPGTRLVTELDAGEGAAYGGRWTHAVEPAGDDGVAVWVIEDGWVGNPFYRVMMHLGGTHNTIDGYLTALARRLGSDAEPMHLKWEGP